MNQKTIWNKIAPAWAEYRNTIFKPSEKFLENKKGKVLDVGCGSGRNFMKKKNLEFYGLDFSEKMLELAKKLNIAKELKLMKKEVIPYDDNSFDYLICIAVLHCIEEEKQRKKLIAETYRVMKKNSEALITVWSKNQERIKNKPKGAVIPWTYKGKRYERYNYTYDKEELENQLKEAGFKIIKSWEDKNINIIVQKSS